MRDTIACRSACCGCADWRRFAQCPTGPLACTGEGPPAQRFLWVCRTVTCLDGSPIDPGRVVLIGGLCWVAEDVTGIPPAGAEVRLSLDPVECTSGCTDGRCPQGELYYPSRPCSPGVEPIWVCGVTECVIRSCHLLDPATGGVPFDQVPPGATVVPLGSLGPPQPSCCLCADPGPPGCLNEWLTDARPSPEDPCYPDAQGEPYCCCTLVDGVPMGRVRVTAMRTTQVVENPNGTPSNNGSITIEILPGSESIDASGCATYLVRSTRVGFGLAGPEILTSAVRLSWGCARCGFWPLRAPRLTGINTGGGEYQLLVGGEGTEWGLSCVGYDTGPVNLTVEEWSARHRCDGMRQAARYVYVADNYPGTPGFDTRITTTFEFEAVVVRWGDEPDTCNQQCGGRIGKSKAPAFPPDDFRSFIAAA